MSLTPASLQALMASTVSVSSVAMALVQVEGVFVSEYVADHGTCIHMAHQSTYVFHKRRVSYWQHKL